MRNRVVVTGMGVVSPDARAVADFKNALKKGKSGIARYIMAYQFFGGYSL